MGIHYDYNHAWRKSYEKRGKAKSSHRTKKSKKTKENPISDKEKMHDIDKPITLEDLTNPDKS